MCTVYCCVYVNTYMTDDIDVDCKDCPYWLELGEKKNDGRGDDQNTVTT